ncbi:hypothetical protein [Rhizobium sp. Root482]|uniref:hypothetical protein n=1 Tax=Rhizobium sp. Root482 TaxID=1736543 RepID=UPI0006FFC838|nr:hypothetical protein [Rhizobium sp. Root482]KQY14418.1 hypothetical protein ASD31_09115 [Rhizobium sp. Root482]
MVSFFDLAKKYEVKENKAHSTFAKGLSAAKSSFEKGEFTRRSWVKESGNGYSLKLGKLETTYQIPTKDEVIAVLDKASEALRSDNEFQAAVENAYNGPLGEEPAVKKPRKKREPKAAAVDTDVLSIPLRPRS